jgi:hypothetical protein
MMIKARLTYAVTIGAAAAVSVFGCSEPQPPASPAAVQMPTNHAGHDVAAGDVARLKDEKGFIDGWFDGGDVNLYYTKLYFCAEPPASGAPTDCVIGADADVPPRGGPIPTIYAIAPVGFQADASTLACRAGTPCLNHPAMIDASRVVGPGATNVPAVAHSHILGERRGGWFHTVNIRVFSASAWDQIVAAKSLAKVRELQGNPATGTPGVISGDTPTNIFFFIASFRND